MNNKLIPTDGTWYKIKKFFKNLFSKKSYNTGEIEVLKNEINDNLTFNENLEERFEKDNQKRVLAEKLLYGELSTNELDDDEVDEMTEYFKKDIQNIDSELLRIKQHILAMRQELKSSQ